MLHNHHHDGHHQQIQSLLIEIYDHLVDGTIHGNGYIMPIVIVCKLFHLVIVELTSQSLQNPCYGVLTLTKTF